MIIYILKYITMATYTNAKEYNTYLVNNDIDINIINYVKEINMEGGASTPLLLEGNAVALHK